MLCIVTVVNGDYEQMLNVTNLFFSSFLVAKNRGFVLPCFYRATWV